MIIMDVEASGLSEESYPIQVALYDSNTDTSEMFYIKPETEWTYWNDDAQDIHNIPQKLLQDMGVDVDVATQRLITFMNSRNETMMYCDAPQFDGFWLNKLFGAANVVSTDLSIHHVYEVCTYKEEVEQLSAIMIDQKRPHDALEDCKMIWDAVHQVLYQ